MNEYRLEDKENAEIRCLCGSWLVRWREVLHCEQCGADYCWECGGRVAQVGGCNVCLSCGASRCHN